MLELYYERTSTLPEKGTEKAKCRNAEMQNAEILIIRNRKIKSSNRKMESLKIEKIQCLKRNI